MKLIKNIPQAEKLEVELSYEELHILRNAFTELSRGGHIESWEFYTRIGFTEDEIWLMVEDITKIMNDEKILAMESSNIVNGHGKWSHLGHPNWSHFD